MAVPHSVRIQELRVHQLLSKGDAEGAAHAKNLLALISAMHAAADGLQVRALERKRQVLMVIMPFVNADDARAIRGADAIASKAPGVRDVYHLARDLRAYTGESLTNHETVKEAVANLKKANEILTPAEQPA